MELKYIYFETIDIDNKNKHQTDQKKKNKENEVKKIKFSKINYLLTILKINAKSKDR